MSMANAAFNRTGSQEAWEPALTLREALKIGIPADEYESAVLYARTAVEEGQRDRISRDRWEPNTSLNEKLAAVFIDEGEQELAGRLEKEADPSLDEAQGLLEDAKANLGGIKEDTQPIAAPEAGTSYSRTRAVERVSQHDVTIERDEAAGRHYHRRVPVLFQRGATGAPWLEAAGFLTFVTYYLNIPLLQPWQDWLGWSFAATVVTVIITGQTWMVGCAATSHNQAREAYANSHRIEAARGFARRNRYICLVAITAFAVTSGMIWRGTAAIGNASFVTTALMIFLAVVTGLLLPTLGYLGAALDGSKVSRERDSLVADLDNDLDEYLETISDIREDVAGVAEIGVTLRDKTFPDICNTTQEAVDAVYGFYSTVRLLIAGLSADPPSKTTKTIHYDASGTISGYIGTSIPGAGKVNLDPLFDRQHRLDEIETQRTRLLNQIDALPPHPWGKSRTT